MANKRELKKAIRRACGEMAGECIMAQEMLSTDENREKWDEIVIDIALLQGDMVRKVGNNFTKANAKELKEHFRSEAEKVVKRMNALLPKKS